MCRTECDYWVSIYRPRCGREAVEFTSVVEEVRGAVRRGLRSRCANHLIAPGELNVALTRDEALVYAIMVS